jgi:hypothetical protein
MTVIELQTELEALGVRRDSYCLDGDADEAYCLRKSSSGWYVYYSERGMESGRKDFSNESSACEYLRSLLVSDSSTH